MAKKPVEVACFANVCFFFHYVGPIKRDMSCFVFFPRLLFDSLWQTQVQEISPEGSRRSSLLCRNARSKEIAPPEEREKGWGGE